MRTDLLIVWPAGAPPTRTSKAVIECKLLRGSREVTVRDPGALLICKRSSNAS